MRAPFAGISLQIALLACALIYQPAAASAQQSSGAQDDEQDEVIRLNTDLVQLRAVVTDRKGQLVDNLTKDDFEVLENGQPQAISFFSVERVAGNGTAQAQEGRPSPRTTARTIVLFVDTLHMSAPTLFRTKGYLRRFVDRSMTDRDLVAIVDTSGKLGFLQQFTSDRKMLRYAIDKLNPFLRATPIFTPELAVGIVNDDENAIEAALIILHNVEGYMRVTPQIDKAYTQGRAREILAQADNLRLATLQVLNAVCDKLSVMRGQRMIAFVSDGFGSFDAAAIDDRLPLQRAIGRAARSGIVIYSMFASGLTAEPTPRGSLAELAYGTGGKAFMNRNDTDLSLKSMLDENSIYYAIAYYPPKGKDEIKFRKVTVRLKNGLKYSVRTQQGYMPAEKRVEEVATTPREKLVKAMIAPLPTTVINVTASADYLEREGDEAQVTLSAHIDGSSLSFEKREKDYLLKCELVFMALNQAGKIVVNSAEKYETALTPEQYEQAKRSGFRYTTRLALKPGFYQVRFGVREVSSERLGTAVSWVEVPDLGKGKPALSSLFLVKEGDALQQTASTSEKRSGARPKLIIGRAVFKQGDSLLYRFVAYNTSGDSQTGGDATVKIEIVQGEKVIYAGEWRSLNSMAVRSDKRGTEAGGRLRLNLGAGVYTLRVTVKDVKSKPAVQQTAEFEVEG